MTPKAYLRLKKRQERITELAQREIEDAMAEVVIPPPTKLRPAKPTDIVAGRIIFYLRDSSADGEDYWQVVSEVHNPGDDFKAYTAEDGCCYGLANAYVEK